MGVQMIHRRVNPFKEITFTEAIKSFLDSAKGQVSVGLKGRTLKQEFNYNKDTMEQWSILSDNSTKGEGKITLKGTGTYPNARLPVFVKPNTKYGILYTVLTSNVPSFHLGAGAYPFTDTAIPAHLGNVKTIQTTKESWTTDLFRFYLTPNSTDEHSITISTPRMFELPPGSEIETDFNTLSADQLAQKYPYISGDSVKSTISAMRLKSVGKNLFNTSNISNFDIANNSFPTQPAKNQYILLPKVKVGATYTISLLRSWTANPNSDGMHVDVQGQNPDGSWVWVVGTSVPKDYSAIDRFLRVTFTVDGTKLAYRLVPNKPATQGSIIRNLQLEEGSQATSYEPYKESTQYIIAKDSEGKIAELRSLHTNGVKDEFRNVNGQWEHVKRTSDDEEISDTDYDSIDTETYTNVDVVKTIAFADAKAGTTGVDGQTRYYNKDGVELTEVAQDDIDLDTSVGKYYWHTDKTLWIIVAKGAYADIAAARTGLGTTKLTYQLAEEVEIPIKPKFFYNNKTFEYLMSFENMTFTQEPIMPVEDYPDESGQLTIPGTVALLENFKCYLNANTDEDPIYVDVTASCTLDTETRKITIANYDATKKYFAAVDVASEESTLGTVTLKYEKKRDALSPRCIVVG